MFIGDSLEIDIIGAKQVGMDQVYYNPQQKEHREIAHPLLPQSQALHLKQQRSSPLAAPASS